MRKVLKIEKTALDGAAWTKVTACGNVIEVLSMEKYPQGCCCKKLDADHYMNLFSGEVLEYTHADTKADCADSVRKTMKRIRNTINANVTDPVCCKFVTLTYAENMTDTERLYSDYKKFWQKLMRYCSRKGIPAPKYITVIEPQGRGAWHAHCIWIWEQPAPFVPNDDIAAMWGHGFTKTKGVQTCDNIGAYFSAYLADMPLSEFEQLPEQEQADAYKYISSIEEKTISEDGVTIQKKFVKGARLFMYPPGMNILRTSRGLKQPDVEVTTLRQAEKKVSAATETFSSAFAIEIDGEKQNTIVKTYYNTKRQKSQEKKEG